MLISQSTYCEMKNYILILFIYIKLIFGNEIIAQNQKLGYDKSKTKSKSGSVWRHEINYPPLTTKSGLRSQVYYLILYLDGTYEQQIFLIPEDKETYKGIKYYQLKGKWSSNEKEISLDENGKIEKIENAIFYTKFENVDNIIINEK
jgi:hypothetical protein